VWLRRERTGGSLDDGEILYTWSQCRHLDEGVQWEEAVFERVEGF
jgi:hypothetical protein